MGIKIVKNFNKGLVYEETLNDKFFSDYLSGDFTIEVNYVTGMMTATNNKTSKKAKLAMNDNYNIYKNYLRVLQALS